MPNINLSSRQRLRLYDLVLFLHKETGKPVVDWMHIIARAIQSNSLTIHPSDVWKIVESWSRREDGVKTVLLRPSLDNESPDSFYRGWDWKITEWTFDKSLLSSFLHEPVEILPPRGLQHAANREGVNIYRDDFRAWWEASNYGPLPRFWFSEETNHLNNKNEPPTETNHKEVVTLDNPAPSEVLRSKQKRYCSQEDKKKAKQAVYSAIQKKIKAGEEYHPRTELRRYMKENEIPEYKETGLVNYIKKKCKDIHWPDGRAPRI